ncbi:helix-turn-helix domain-containing protein [Caldanaerobacter subterraneus]|uniref:helix-turn-helix domain-containing protein n=1 Tax=Caldanaerobacter subterraneus TaxID=911092 RepID=UPI0019FB08AA|nr:helix-turn-helix transcriptional regulator [Caldanaerobacter subterraneus]
MTKLEFLRRSMGLSQRKFAEELGIHPTIVSQVEKGFRKPYPKFLQKAAEVLGVQVTDLVDNEGNLTLTNEEFMVIPIRRG